MEVEEDNTILRYIENYLQIFPEEVSIWLKYLAVKAQLSDSWEELQGDFKIAFQKLDGKNALPLWEMYVDLATDLEFKQATAVFEEVIDLSRKELRNHFLVRYLDWLNEKTGIKACRKLYRRFLGSRLELEFLQRCIEIEEEGEEKVDIKAIRKLYEKMVNDYGTENTEVWISFIGFEKKYNSINIDASSAIYLRARNTLTGKLNDEFITKFTLLQNQ